MIPRRQITPVPTPEPPADNAPPIITQYVDWDFNFGPDGDAASITLAPDDALSEFEDRWQVTYANGETIDIFKAFVRFFSRRERTMETPAPIIKPELLEHL